MMKRVLMGSGALSLCAGAAFAGGQGVPLPNDPPAYAEPGQCYQRILVRAEYDRYVDEYLSREAYDRIEVTEPALETRSRDYLRKEAGVRYVVRQPVYETVTEQVLVQPEYERLVVEPARLETVTERVMVREPQMVWKRGRLPGAKAYRYDEETGDVWCLIEEAGEYRTIERQVVVQPEEVRSIPVPPQYATIEKEVLVQPGGVEEIPIPAEYASYNYQEVVQTAGHSRYRVEAQMASIEKHQLVSPQRYEWRLVECDQIPVLEQPHHPRKHDDGWRDYQEKDGVPASGFKDAEGMELSYYQPADNRVLNWNGKR